MLGNREHVQNVLSAKIEGKVLPFSGAAQRFMVRIPGKHMPWISTVIPMKKKGKKISTNMLNFSNFSSPQDLISYAALALELNWILSSSNLSHVYDVEMDN